MTSLFCLPVACLPFTTPLTSLSRYLFKCSVSKTNCNAGKAKGGGGLGKEMYTLGLRLHVRHTQPVNVSCIFRQRSKTAYYLMYSKNNNSQFVNQLLQHSNCVTESHLGEMPYSKISCGATSQRNLYSDLIIQQQYFGC